MVGFLVCSAVLAPMIFSLVQLLVLWSGQGAVETAAHFAARKFAFNARADLVKAKAAALAEASSICRNRIGGRWATANLTSLKFARNGNGGHVAGASAGEAYEIRLTHGVELIVPLVDRLLYRIAPVPKAKIGDRYYLLLNATRWTTVE